jgi:hypothetical protein
MKWRNKTMKKRIKCTYCHRVHITNKKGLCSDCTKEIEEKQFLETRIRSNKYQKLEWIVFEFNWDKKNTKHFLQFSEMNHIRQDDKCYVVIYSLNDLLDIDAMLNVFCSINNLEAHKIRADISNIGLQNRIEVVEIDKIYKEF